MTPEQLKSSILQYAIQGKLVEQRVEEGTGEELYKKIQSEKQRLIKEGKIKKEKILPEISEDEVPFDIPESWKWVRLGSLGDYKKGPFGSALTKSIFVSKGRNTIKVYEQKNAIQKDNKIGEYYITKSYFEESMTSFEVLPGDVIVSCAGTIGETYVLPDDIEKGIINQALMRVRVTSFMCVKYFLLYFETILKNVAKSHGKGSAIKNIPPLGILKNYIVALPPLGEQKRIIATIEELLPYVERYASNYEKLEKLNAGFPDDMKKSILQYAIQGKLVEQRAEEGTGDELYKKIQSEKQILIKAGKIKREKVLPEINDDEIPFEIPDSWKWVRWGELSFSIQYGYNAPAKISGRIKMVRITDIQNGVIDWDNVPFCDIDEKDIDKYKLAENDILFARTGGTVGKSYIVRDILEESIYAGYLIRTRYSNMLDPMYLYYFMQTNLYWNQLRTGTISTAQPNCNGQTLSKMLIPLPPIIEQQRIVSKVEELLQCINTSK